MPTFPALCTNYPTYTWIQGYTVWFTDAEEYAFAVSVMGGTSFLKNPFYVSFALNAPLMNGAAPAIPNWNEGGTKGIYATNVPFDFSFSVGLDVGNPGVPVILTSFIDSVHVPCFGASSSPQEVYANRDVFWGGNIVFMDRNFQGDDPTEDTSPIPIRRWITGFESEFGSEGTGNNGLIITRDSSRINTGVGAAIRRSTNKNFLRAVNVYQVITPVNSWERFYLRVRKFDPTNRIDIWKCESSPSPNSGIRLYLNIDGSINTYNVNSAGVETLLDTSPVIFILDEFVRLDLLINYNPAASLGQGRFRLYVDGLLAVDEIVVAASGGIGQVSTTHLQSRLGTQILASANVWELDFDDWHNAGVPTAVIGGIPTESLTSIDWTCGTHCKLVRNTTALTTGWTGQMESTNQMMSPVNVSTGSRITSTTSLAVIDATTSVGVGLFDGLIDNTGIIVGSISAILAKYGSRAANNGRLGYALADGANVLTTITEAVGAQHNTVAYLASGTDINPPEMAPFHIVHEKGTGAGLATVFALQSLIEYVGFWGTEDIADFPGLQSDKFFIHNGAYWSESPWGGAFEGEGFTCVHSGIYIGNSTFQTIEAAEVPFHFLFVRPLTGGTTNGFRWFASGLTGHLGARDGSDPESPVNVYWDSVTQTANFTVVGTDPDVNANGVSYQWMVFADPMTRYNICGAFCHSTATTLADNPIFNTLFTPEACFTQFENTISAGTNTRLSYKGPGHTADSGTQVDGTNLTNYLTFFIGILESHASAHAANQTTYSAWRTVDGSGSVMVQITSYTGNGVGTDRVIPLTPASNRFPGLAIVIPHNGIGVFRDPSHAGLNSGRLTDATNNLTTSIRAGAVDSITVGTNLNSNGIIYDVFVIPGDPLGWNQFDWCSNQTPPEIFPPPPVAEPPDIALLPEGGLILGATGGVPLSLLRDISGIYTLVKDKTSDTYYDRQTGQTSIEMKIPDPTAKGGYIGG